ncbi:hypothetical protein M514_03962 [Trichuris suis]|uniref:Abnormal cell migration protein 18-like fibronectin type I domain-containing protein n=1 Tax=Trichuris suis TaxID=68888 RepID=A0A085MCU8_9BILA|nr:hypothetical protein M513_03962 [Trichuris suis]KFD72597.1 hypothetical protein M514_03962 [Trichuris suis]KHJ48698.1 hypothetical protein D918_01000 [Trichuris suis]
MAFSIGFAWHSLLLFFLAHQLVIAQSDQASRRTAKRKLCPGGYSDGTEVTKGRYVYHCTNGKLRPKGCLSADGKQLALWQTFPLSGYQLMCALDKNNLLYFKYVGCVSNGTIYYPTDTWADKSFWYTCRPLGETLIMEVSGCVYKNHRYDIGEDFRKGDFYFQCHRTSTGTVALRPVACHHKGRRYNIGENYEEDKFWYACTMEAGRAVKKCVGCMHYARRLMDGDRYFIDTAIYECTIRQHHSDHRLVGCVQQDDNRIIERRLGCQWLEGNAPYKYMLKCARSQGKEKVKLETVSCFYQMGEGAYAIPPGCFRIVGDKGVACINRPNGPTIEEFPTNDLYKAYYKGVRPC